MRLSLFQLILLVILFLFFYYSKINIKGIKKLIHSFFKSQKPIRK